jgi:flagellar protein FlbT
MKSTLRITLKPGEKIYVNGAVLRADRKVSLEFLNDVQFLLETHVLQPDDATTPLRQLYFVIQTMLMAPDGSDQAQLMYRRSLPLTMSCFGDERVRAALKDVDRCVWEGQVYEALKILRGLYGLEEMILAGAEAARKAETPIAVGA